MTTYSQISIRHLLIDTVIEEIKKNYKITFQLMIPIIEEWYFNDYEKNISTIIVSCNYNTDWVDIQFSNQELTDCIIFDFLIYLSKKYKTIILLGKLQTSTAEAQFIKLENGIIQYNIAQNLIEDKIVMTQKFGLENSNNIFKSDLPEVGQAFNSEIQKNLDLDDWNNFFWSSDREPNLDSQTHFEEYIHLRWHKISHDSQVNY